MCMVAGERKPKVHSPKWLLVWFGLLRFYAPATARAISRRRNADDESFCSTREKFAAVGEVYH